MVISILQYGQTLVAQLGVSIVAAVLVGWAALKFFGKAWVKSLFDKDLAEFNATQARELEAFKAERTLLLDQLRYSQSREMESHKHRFQRMMDRAAKLHQHEFEVLPEIWDRLSSALSATASLVSRLQSYPDIEKMGDGELREFIRGVDIHDWEKDTLLGTPTSERNAKLMPMLKWQRLRETARRHQEFHNYLISRGIFLREELREAIRELSNLNYDAFQEYKLDLEMGEERWEGRFKNRDRFIETWDDGMNKIQAMVEDRLWESAKLEG